MSTGVQSYVGTIRMTVGDNATSTHTFRGLKVLDTGTTGWRIFLATSASVVINGGLYCVNNVALADFLAVGLGTLFPSATGSNQKATYLLQDPANIGVGQLNIASTGVTLDIPNNKVYVHNGVAATHQFYVYNTSATLNCPLTVGVTIDSTTDFLTHTAHGFLNNDPVFITNLSGGAGLTNNSIYYVRNITANTYQLSLTSGGAVINITTNGTVDVCRAFGTTGDAFVHKTGNLPALAGVLISSDSEDYAVPQHTANSGQPCIFFCTTTNLYLGRISELTPAATTWASLVTSNLLGTPNQIIAPLVALATWSNVLDRAIYLTNTNILVMKQVMNNSIDKIFAGANNIYRETFVSDTVPLQWLAAGALDVEDGWLVVQTLTNVGQRGVLLCDLRSDELFDYSYIVTPVLNTPSSVYKYIDYVQSNFWSWQSNHTDNYTHLPKLTPSQTEKLLKAARKYNQPKIIYSSTSSIYGNNKIPFTEDMAPDCLNHYSVSKLAGENLCKVYSNLHGLKTIILRYFNVYGPRQTVNSSYGSVLGNFIERKRQNLPVIIYGDGNQTRDFTHVDDVVNANLLAAINKSHIEGDIFNIGSGKNYSMNHIAELLNLDKKYEPIKRGENKHTLANIPKARFILGYEPLIGLEDYLKTIE